MKTFLWHGTLENTPQSGTIEAPDKIIAQALLQDKNIQTIELKALKKTTLQAADKQGFLMELHYLLSSELPLLNAINIIGKTQARLFSICQKIETDLNAGESLAGALKNQNLYPNTYYALIQIGEQTGHLTTILASLVKQEEQTQTITSNIKKALLYPSFVLAMTVFVLFAMLYFIVPKFTNMYQEFGAQLPTFTKLLMHASTLLTNHSGVLAIACLSLICGAFFAWKHAKHTFLNAFLHIPHIKTLLTDSLFARLFFLLQTCLRAGLTLKESLSLCENSISYPRYQNAFATLQANLNAGQSFSQALSQVHFPERICQWVLLAENTGSLESACKLISDYYSNSLKQKTEKISLLIEPIIMVVLGLMIGSLVIALYLPLFQMGLAI